MRRAFLAAFVSLLMVAVAGPALTATAVKPYVVSLSPAYSVRPLLSVADRVPETSNNAIDYQMIGIPDGLGLSGKTLFMNHELTNATLSEPEIGQPRYKGAFVSKYKLSKSGDPISGERAYDTIFAENAPVGAAPTEANSTAGFGRLCSGSLAGSDVGFDRPVFLSGEEADGAATFDGRGGQMTAIFDNELHTLPKLGRFAKENAIVQAGTGNNTVIMDMEDGPAGLQSQLFMYVGTKDRSPGQNAMRRNGLDNGKLYVLVGDNPALNGEDQVTSGTANVHWTEIVGAEGMTDVQLESAVDALGAYEFVRTEDGAFSKTNDERFYFVTTGGTDGINAHGRLYELNIDTDNPTDPTKLKVLYNADAVVASGGDTAMSPDNIDTSKNFLMINEDGVTQSRVVMGNKGRDGSIWRFPLKDGDKIDVGARSRVVELDPPGRDNTAVGPGIWETSGIIDASDTFGKDTWLSDVQAHSPTAAPAPNTVEDGQLFIMEHAKQECPAEGPVSGLVAGVGDALGPLRPLVRGVACLVYDLTSL